MFHMSWLYHTEFVYMSPCSAIWCLVWDLEVGSCCPIMTVDFLQNTHNRHWIAGMSRSDLWSAHHFSSGWSDGWYIGPPSEQNVLVPISFGIPTFCLKVLFPFQDHIDGLVQDCSISIASTLEILQSCTKTSIYIWQCYNQILLHLIKIALVADTLLQLMILFQC